ncbi:MAG: BtrH N-terminal domain-containing protein [Myxococcota bacterium]
MKNLVESYTHRTGQHCASTALRNLLAHQGTVLSEGMVFGLASGLGFFYLQGEGISPTRMFHGRTMTLENDLGPNTGIPLTDRVEPDDDRALAALRQSIDGGLPVMISTDTFYLEYHDTTSHFPGHRCVVVGYDDASETVLIADRKFGEYQRCSYGELRQARNARDYAMSCENRYGDFEGEAKLGRPLDEAIAVALGKNARDMLEPRNVQIPAGVPALRQLASEFPDWSRSDDWSWAARFGYQVVIKRGAGGSFFRSLYAEFLRESGARIRFLGEALPATRMDVIAARWRDLAALLKEQSERDDCDRDLFVRAGGIASDLADAEEAFFSDALRVAEALGS